MKQKYSFALLAIVSILSFSSCKKDMHDRNEIKNVDLNIALTAGASYQLDLSKYGDADDVVSIATQATHFDVSAINQDFATKKYNYQYKAPAADPKVTTAIIDKVVIKVSEPANRCHKDETNITINFTIQ